MLVSEFGLDMRAYYKVLLCFHGDAVYGANDEDSDALNEVLDWPRSRTDWPSPMEDPVIGSEERVERLLSCLLLIFTLLL